MGGAHRWWLHGSLSRPGPRPEASRGRAGAAPRLGGADHGRAGRIHRGCRRACRADGGTLGARAGRGGGQGPARRDRGCICTGPRLCTTRALFAPRQAALRHLHARSPSAARAKPPPPAPRPAPKHVQGIGRRVRRRSTPGVCCRPGRIGPPVFAPRGTRARPQPMPAAKQFLAKALDGYPTGRNIPGEDLTSMLSPHLHWGELSPAQVWHRRAGRFGAEALRGLPVRTAMA